MEAGSLLGESKQSFFFSFPTVVYLYLSVSHILSFFKMNEQ